MATLTRRVLLAALPAACMAIPPAARAFDAPPESHRVLLRDVTVDGRAYRLFMAEPVGVPPASGWPSLWMLDGNAVFERLTAEDLRHHPRLAVVGIGYPGSESFDTTARALDYTPTSPPDTETARGRMTGGADAFRARLTGPLRRAAAERVALDPARCMLWGHSYGGLFTLHCLMSEPLAFSGWIAASPSSGFGGGVLRGLAATAPHLPPERVAPVRILLGDSEHRRGSPPPGGPRPNPETLALAEVLERRADLEVRLTVLKGLGHGATFAASFPQALELAEAAG
ncbi:alpha/beta hydrolase [Paenirhodobacter sp.]|uniref:alpha/beta hydrolase n=1 Tax=Paenirhodobacter sp. TaxID=1965326 RepID=UPI003B4261D8